jgi:uncharacterized protein (TIGR03437 family)
MVPYEIAGRATTTVRISYRGVQSEPVVYNVTASAPGIYTQNSQGFGPGAIRNQDFSYNGPNNPAAKGSVVSVVMTGEGVTNPGSTTGAVTPGSGSGLNRPVLLVSATVAGVTARVFYAGSAPGFVYGVMQANVEIPLNVPSGAQPIVITVGANQTQTGVTVAVQ